MIGTSGKGLGIKKLLLSCVLPLEIVHMHLAMMDCLQRVGDPGIDV